MSNVVELKIPPKLKIETTRTLIRGMLEIRIVPRGCVEAGTRVNLKPKNNYNVFIVLRSAFNIADIDESSTVLLASREGRTLTGTLRIAVMTARRRFYVHALFTNDIKGQLSYLNFRIRRVQVSTMSTQKRHDKTK